jgi:hypothetical protein
MRISRHPAAFLLPVLILALAGMFATAPAGAADDSADPRFSSTLSPDQLKETGLDQLSTDNVAVIDALVRLDVAALRLRNNNIRSTRFSERRTDHERDIAGFGHLTPDQLAKLDQFVSLRIPAPVIPASADLSHASVSLDAVRIPYKRPAPEIHGSVTLTYGGGKGGSFRGAESVLTYVDPSRHFAVTVGYSQYSGSGLGSYPYSNDGGYTPYYRPLPVIIPDER